MSTIVWLQGYKDIATLSDLTTTTGGTLYQYTPFNPAMDHDRVRVWCVGGSEQVKNEGSGLPARYLSGQWKQLIDLNV